jgi:uncharacterized protein DUF6297
VTVASDPIAVPDSTGPTIALLRDLRRGRGRKQAASIAFWIYLVAFTAAVYGGSLIAAAYRAVRHPPPATPAAGQVLRAAPAGLAALALLLLLVLVRDALWRGPVTVPQATVDWLLDTPVDRGRLLRPRFRLSAAGTVLAGAAVGIVPAAALVAAGLGGHGSGDVLDLTGAAVASVALLFALGTGTAGLIERYPPAARWVRAATPAVLAGAALLAGLAAWAALGRPPAVLSAIAVWSGPWGWSAQPVLAAAGHTVSGSLGSTGVGSWWPLAVLLLAVAALTALAAADRAAAGVSSSVLRARAAALGAMSAAALSMNTRGVAAAYQGATRTRRAAFRLRPPRRRGLILLWRDLLAIARAPTRLAAAVTVAVAAAGLMILAVRARHVSLVPVACALTLGYLAAAWLCEGARLDADDPRRSVPLPFRFASLAWWHAAVPGLVLLAAAGVPVVVACVLAGDPRPLALLVVTIPVLVAGALLNVFRAPLTPELFMGFDTPVGNTAAINIVIWVAWGPVLSVGPMTVLLSRAVSAPGSGALASAVVIGAGLAVGLGAYAAHRASRLRAG